MNQLEQQLILQQVQEEAQRDFSVSKLDPGRQHDVIQCLFAIRTSKKPQEVAAARKALQTIFREYQDKRLRDVRRWLMKEREHGRHENVKNLYADIDRDKKKWNPYG